MIAAPTTRSTQLIRRPVRPRGWGGSAAWPSVNLQAHWLDGHGGHHGSGSGRGSARNPAIGRQCGTRGAMVRPNRGDSLPGSARRRGRQAARGRGLAHARHGSLDSDGELPHRFDLPHGPLPPVAHHPLGRRPLRHRLQHRADGPVPQAEATRPGFVSLHAAVPCARTGGTADPPHRIRMPLDPRRTAPAPVGDALGPSVQRDPAGGRHLAGLGAAPRRQRRDHLVQPPDSGGVGHGLDSGRTRHLVARCTPRQVVAAGRGGQRRLGLVVWVFGEAFGGIFAPGATWLFGAPGAVLFYCVAGDADRTARTCLRDAATRPHHPCRGRGLPDRHGAAAGVARAGILAGARRHAARPWCRRWQRRPSPASCPRGSRPSARFDAAHGWAVNLFAVVRSGCHRGAAVERAPSTRLRRR